MMNAMNVPSKRSTLERKLDKVIATLFGVLLSMCLIGAIGCAVFLSNKYHYLELWINGDSQQFSPNNRLVVFVVSIFTLITLYYSNFSLCFYRGGFMVLGGMNLIQICARRTPTMIYVRESHVEKMGKVQDAAYEIVNILEFNSSYSTRKRQSVVCRYGDGRLVLYCKGADTIIYERLASGNDELKKVSREQLEKYGEVGLRTLCLAYRDLTQTRMKVSLRDRERKLDEVAELIEKDLTLIGCTAIEDEFWKGCHPA